ncbi:hypothetical protein [Puniceibacterium sediminis]|uniref:Uncharacterized protein n=1 Tax=Puniceibacterium sediminis TaxID=1608407 RepID=A0A238XTI5_9RHOB|nr:hypothetical protein [Puniceibacterium sediminis]SNR62366.1 hypothetical protein SAMN06265370_11328 [Puniceibacterium sediminis]
MTLGRREQRFVHRVVVLITVAVVMGIGVVVVKESGEIRKLIEPSFARDLLLLFAPLAGLAMTGYTLASKTFSSGGLLAEFVALVGSYSLFMAVALPSFFKRELASGEACRFWQLSCEETLSVRDNRITLLFVILALILVSVALYRARVIRAV